MWIKKEELNRITDRLLTLEKDTIKLTSDVYTFGAQVRKLTNDKIKLQDTLNVLLKHLKIGVYTVEQKVIPEHLVVSKIREEKK